MSPLAGVLRLPRSRPGLVTDATLWIVLLVNDMKIFLAGATGIVGRRLIPLLLSAGHEVTGTARSPEKAASLGLRLGARHELGIAAKHCWSHHARRCHKTLCSSV